MSHCYRHPGRETAVSCSSCGRPICPDCMTPSPVGMRCPECAGQRQQVISARQVVDPRLIEIAPVTAVLIAINVIVYLAELLTGTQLASFSGPASGDVMLRGVFFGPSVADGEWWRIVSAGFIHFGVFHLGMNMALLYMLGRLLEHELGSARFVAIYAFSLVGGSMGALLVEPTSLAGGASGAVFGLMGAAFIANRARGIDPWKTELGGLIILNLILTFAIPGISKGDHIGGLIAGIIAGFLLIDLDETRQVFGRSKIPAIAIATVATVALFALTVVVAQNKWPAIAAL